jgi:hypothetical protein
MKKLLYSLLIVIVTAQAQGQLTSDYAVLVSSTYTTSPPSITLVWPEFPGAISYDIFKKEKSDVSWGSAIASLPGGAVSYLDEDVVIDSIYEYKVVRDAAGIVAEGYLSGGIELSIVDYRGTCLLVIDTTITGTLSEEVYQLKKDISGDGWAVEELPVSREFSPEFVRNLIITRTEANDDIKALYLFGRVPVLYSGNLYPDGHPEHQGAWPADGIYGDIDAEYSDATINNTTAARIENQNIPGDGKYDQSVFKSKIELQVGRVDLFNMPTFATEEASLLKRYLTAEHQFKTGATQFARRGLIDDNFGAFGGEAFASSGWRNFAPMFSSNEIYAVDYFTTLYNDSYLWAYGCGGGWFQGASGVGSTYDYFADTVKSVFTMMFGSYFGDWDAVDNFLRAPLASGMALTNCWAGRPHWQFHHMVLGENIGYSTMLSQNNQSTYVSNIFPKWVHIALMGDPTLRMHVVLPVSEVTCSIPLGETAIIGISYSPAADPDVIGYHVYRSETEFGKYIRISDELIAGTDFIDNSPLQGVNHYMVKAVKLEETPSGSYYNTSIGVGDSIFIEYVDIQNLDEMAYNIYPNPAVDFITIEANNQLLQLPYTISNISGAICNEGIIDAPLKQINIQHLNNGVYTFSSGNVKQQFVITH